MTLWKAARTDEELAAELDKLHAMIEAGVHAELAVAEALHHCARYERPAPKWLLVHATKLICRSLNDSTPRPPKAHTPGRKYLKAMADYTRWECMDEVLDGRRMLKGNLKHLKAKSRTKNRKLIDAHLRKLAEAGATWGDAAKWVANNLRGTAARGSAETVRKSYFKVQKPNPRSQFLYHQFSPAVLKEAGLKL